MQTLLIRESDLRFVRFIEPQCGMKVEYVGEQGTVIEVSEDILTVDCGDVGTCKWYTALCRVLCDDDGNVLMSPDWILPDTVPYSAMSEAF